MKSIDNKLQPMQWMLKVCKEITSDNIVMVTSRWISMVVLNSSSYDWDDVTHFSV